MRKHLLSTVLAIALLLGSVSAPVFAEGLATGDGTTPAAGTPETAASEPAAAPEPGGQAAGSAGDPADDVALPADTDSIPDGGDVEQEAQKRYNGIAAPDPAPQAETRGAAAVQVVSLPTAAGITYGQTLEQAVLTGGSVVAEDGTAVEGSFAWKTPGEKPDAGTHEYDVVFTPKEEQFAAVDAGKVQVTVAQAAVTITWRYDVESVNYIGKPVVVTPPEVTTPDGAAHIGEIAYEYRADGESSYQKGLPQNAGTYYVRASIAAQGNYLGAATEKELKLLIQKRNAQLVVEDYARRYNGDAVTLEEIPKEARGYLGETLTGTWSFKDGTPELKEAGGYDVTLIFTPEDPDYGWQEKTIRVTIQPIDLTDAEVKVTGSYTYNAAEQTPQGSAVTVTLDGNVIPESEYELTYENNRNAGQAVVVANGRHNYAGAARGRFAIAPVPLTVTGITVNSREYDETNKMSVESLTLEGILESDKGEVQADPASLTATVEGTDAGTYDTVVLGASMELEGSAKDNYTLPCKELTFTGDQVNGGQGATITPAVFLFIRPIVSDRVYDGTTDVDIGGIDFALRPAITSPLPVTFQVECETADAGRVQVQGTATLTDDNFIFRNGEMTTEIDPVYINIVPRPVQLKWSGDFSVVYDGRQHAMNASIVNRVGEDDVTLVLEDNVATAPGSHWAKAKALEGADKDNYTLSGGSELMQAWEIKAIDLSEAEVTPDKTSFVYNAAEQRPTFTVKLDGKTLVEGTDYKVRCLDNTTNAGTVRVVILGINNYKEAVQTSYTITPAPLTITGVELAPKTYDGTAGAEVESVTFDGVPDGQTLSARDYTAAAAFADADAGTDKEVAVTVTMRNKNYTLRDGTFRLSGQTIRKKEATVAVQLDPANRIYVKDPLPAVGLAYTGLVEGESLAPAHIRVEGMPPDTDTAGEYKLTVSQATREGILALDAARNYQIAFADETLTIVEKGLGLVPDSGQDQGTEQNLSADLSKAEEAAATLAPDDGTVYYACPACGTHDWTADADGYRCDHCGYLESARQLNGYGNVKGLYTPGTGSTAANATDSTVAVPRTGDDQNLALWGILLVLSGAALAVLAIKRKQ